MKPQLEEYNLFLKMTERDFSGSKDDEYAQLLMTIFCHIGDDIFPLLSEATKNNKRLDVKDVPEDEIFMQDFLITEDIIFVDYPVYLITNRESSKPLR